MEQITSRANPLLARVRKLSASASFRREQGVCVCDSPKLLAEALAWSRVEAVVHTGRIALPSLPPETRAVCVPEDVMRSVSPSRTPQGVLGVCAIPERPLPARLDGRRYLVLDALQDPGNTGTILRAADALGADGVFLLPGCADVYSPKALRASMGAAFRLPAWRCETPVLCALLERSGIPLYGAAAEPGAVDVRHMPADGPVAVAIGSEGRGLSRDVRAFCTGLARIPMRARCESLNAGLAAGIMLWQLGNPE